MIYMYCRYACAYMASARQDLDLDLAIDTYASI